MLNPGIRAKLAAAPILAGVLLAAVPGVCAQDYPARAIRIVLPFSPGGGFACWRIVSLHDRRLHRVPVR